MKFELAQLWYVKSIQKQEGARKCYIARNQSDVQRENCILSVSTWRGNTLAIDLFDDDLGKISDQDLSPAIVSFLQMPFPQERRTVEGYIIDFRRKWRDKAAKTVVA